MQYSQKLMIYTLLMIIPLVSYAKISLPASAGIQVYDDLVKDVAIKEMQTMGGGLSDALAIRSLREKLAHIDKKYLATHRSSSDKTFAHYESLIKYLEPIAGISYQEVLAACPPEDTYQPTGCQLALRYLQNPKKFDFSALSLPDCKVSFDDTLKLYEDFIHNAERFIKDGQELIAALNDLKKEPEYKNRIEGIQKNISVIRKRGVRAATLKKGIAKEVMAQKRLPKEKRFSSALLSEVQFQFKGAGVMIYA